MKTTKSLLNLCFIFLGITLITSCQKPTGLKEKTWISTYNGAFSTAGIIFDIQDHQNMVISNINKVEYSKQVPYHINKFNHLIVDTIDYGKIITQSDSVLIIKDSIRTHTFIPLKDYRIKTDTTALTTFLTANDWKINNYLGLLRMKLEKTKWPFGKHLKTYFEINETEGLESINQEWWTLRTYKNSIFIILSKHQVDYQIYQVKSISDSIITTETCWHNQLKEEKFTRCSKLNPKSYEERQSMIIGEWQVNNYEKLLDDTGEEIIITSGADGRNRPFSKKDSVPMIFDSYYKTSNITHHFSTDSTCSITTKDQILRTSKWHLSEDGNYIYTDDGFMRFMKILSLTDSSLVIRKHEIIEYKDLGQPDRNDWEDIYIQASLKKIK